MTTELMGRTTTSPIGRGRRALGNLETGFGRPAHGFKPAADIHLGVSFVTEMPGGGIIGGSQIPLDDRELLISTLDHKPMDRILTDDPANLASEFLQIRHAFSVSEVRGGPPLMKV
jgi:hypothetical protein